MASSTGSGCHLLGMLSRAPRVSAPADHTLQKEERLRNTNPLPEMHTPERGQLGFDSHRWSKALGCSLWLERVLLHSTRWPLLCSSSGARGRGYHRAEGGISRL